MRSPDKTGQQGFQSNQHYTPFARTAVSPKKHNTVPRPGAKAEANANEGRRLRCCCGCHRRERRERRLFSAPASSRWPVWAPQTTEEELRAAGRRTVYNSNDLDAQTRDQTQQRKKLKGRRHRKTMGHGENTITLTDSVRMRTGTVAAAARSGELLWRSCDTDFLLLIEMR